MRISTCFNLSCYHLWRRKKRSFQLLLNLTLIAIALMVWLVMTFSLKYAHDKYLYEAASSNYQPFSLEVQEGGSIVEDENYIALKTALEWPETAEPTHFSIINFMEYLGRENWSFVNVKYVSLTLDDTQYQGVNDYSYDFVEKFDRRNLQAEYSVPFDVAVVFSPIAFTQNDIIEFNYRNPNSSYILHGSAEVDEGKLLISDYMLARFGITEDLDSLIGKTISFSVEEQVAVKQYTIGGILDSRLFRVSGLAGYPQIIIPSNGIIETYNIKYSLANLPFTDYKYTKEALAKLHDLGVRIEFYVWEIAEYYHTISGARIIVQRLVSLFGLLICIAIIMNLCNILMQSIDSRRSQYGILRAIGMPKGALYTIAYLELLIMTLFAMVIALTLSWFFLQFMNKMMYSMIQTELALSWQTYFYIACGTVSGISLISFLLEIPMLRSVLNTQLPELLSSD